MRTRFAVGWVTMVAILALTTIGGVGGEKRRSRSAAPEEGNGHILPPPASFRFLDGQKLVYAVEWHMLNAGTATILARPSAEGERLLSTADSKGMVNKLYSVHDRMEALVDPRTFCTQQISKHSEEGQRRLERSIHFNYAETKSAVDDRDLKSGRSKHAEFHIPACVSDVVGGFFYVSSLPLEPGLSETFPVNDGGETTIVRVEVETREKVRVPSGEYSAVRVKAQPILGPMQGKGMIWAWFAETSAKRIPVEIKSKLGFATLVLRLQRIETTANLN